MQNNIHPSVTWKKHTLTSRISISLGYKNVKRNSKEMNLRSKLVYSHFNTCQMVFKTKLIKELGNDTIYLSKKKINQENYILLKI